MRYQQGTPPTAPHNANRPCGRVTYRNISRFGGGQQPGTCVVGLGAHSGWGTWTGLPWAVGLRAVPYGLLAAPHNANRPDGRVTHRYMSGHGLVVANSRAHAWWGWELILAGAPGRGFPGRWGCGPYRMASWPLHTTPTALTDVLHIGTCLGTVWWWPTAGHMRGGAGSSFWLGHLDGASLGGGVAGRTVWPPAAPHNANRPGGRVTHSYMSGHVLVMAHSRGHAWWGWEPILAGAP